jgi:TatD DNase family protein
MNEPYAFVDTHAHLTSREFDADREEVLRRAEDAGVRSMLNPATDVEDARRACELAERHPAVYAAVGIHPHRAATADQAALAEIESLCAHPRVVAVGEIGLDFHYNLSPRDAQVRAFEAQLEIAQKKDLPVIIHTRDSIEETLRIVEESLRRASGWRAGALPPKSRHPAPKGVFHCYSGDVQTAWKLIGLGFSLSFPGILTFKNAHLPQEVASGVSLEHLLLETDSPYMAPVPNRGKRNEPAFIRSVAEKLAQLQHLSLSDVARSTAYGAYRLFGIGEMPGPRFTYTLRDSLYINLTIRCNADCVFCDRKVEAVIKGHNLRIEREPEADEVVREIGDPTRYREIVFCGYGEPTIRLDVLKEVARAVKAKGGRTRLNTDGHGNVINKRNIVPELVGLIDAVSVSLNTADPEQYGRLMKIDSRFFGEMVAFAKECVRSIGLVMMTIVDLPEVDAERAKQLVEKEIGGEFVTRPFF